MSEIEFNVVSNFLNWKTIHYAKVQVVGCTFVY